MSPTPNLPTQLIKVQLVQGQSLEPSLRFTVRIKVEANGNNGNISEIFFINAKSRVYTSNSDKTNQ
mgnify:CR=1 FL=1